MDVFKKDIEESVSVGAMLPVTKPDQILSKQTYEDEDSKIILESLMDDLILSVYSESGYFEERATREQYRLSKFKKKYNYDSKKKTITVDGGDNKGDIVFESVHVESDMSLDDMPDVPKTMKLFHGSPKQGLKYILPKSIHIAKEMGKIDLVFASDDKRVSACFGGRWHDGIGNLSSWDNWKTVTFSYSDDVKMDEPCSMYELENDGSFKRFKTKEVISPHKIKVKKEIKYNSFKEMLEENGVELQSMDEHKKRMAKVKGKNYIKESIGDKMDMLLDL